jgi:hypothetical protein
MDDRMNDRREFPRHSVQIVGKLLSADMLHCVDVVIKELSEGGALVSAALPAAFPKRGYLWQEKTGTVFECEVRWLKNGRLFGLRFDASARDRLRTLIAACATTARDTRGAARFGLVRAQAA